MHPDEPHIGTIFHAHSAKRAFHSQRLGFGQSLRAVGQQLFHGFCAGVFKIGQRHHLVYETDAARVMRAKTLAVAGGNHAGAAVATLRLVGINFAFVISC